MRYVGANTAPASLSRGYRAVLEHVGPKRAESRLWSRPPMIDAKSRLPRLLLAGLAGSLLSTPALAETAQPPASVTAQTATVLYPVVARKSPSAGSGKVADVAFYTAFSRSDNVLLVSDLSVNPNGQVEWIKVHLPGRPNGRMGWLPRAAVMLGSTNTRIKVRLKSRVVETYIKGGLTGTYRAAVGTGGTPTPTGHFSIQDPYHTSGSEANTYGPWILTLTAYSNVLKTFGAGPGTVAIHGWPDASVIGKAASHGCIRVTNASVAAIAKVAKGGTPVDIVDD